MVKYTQPLESLDESYSILLVIVKAQNSSQKMYFLNSKIKAFSYKLDCIKKLK